MARSLVSLHRSDGPPKKPTAGKNGGSRHAFSARLRPTPPESHDEAGAAEIAARDLDRLLELQSQIERAEKRAERLALLNQASVRLAGMLREPDLLDRILEEVDLLASYDTAALYLLSNDGTRLRAGALRGFSPDQEKWVEEAANEGIPGTIVRSRESVLLRDAWSEPAAQPSSREVTHRLGIRGMLFVPILAAGAPLGVIALGRHEPNSYGPEDLEVVRSLADHAGMAIAYSRHHRQVHRELESKLRDLTTLSRIGQSIGASLQTETVLQNIVLSTAEAFKPSISAIVLLDEQRDELRVAAISDFHPMQVGRRFQVEGSASGWVIRHGEPLFVPWTPVVPFAPLKEWFYNEGIKSWIGVPLVILGKTVGSLNVYSRTGTSYEPGDLELLRGLAAQAAISIEHADLYQSVTEEKAKLEAIVESLDEGLLVGSSGTTVYASRRFSDLLDLDARALEGATLSQLWDRVAVRCGAPAEARERLESLESGAMQPVLLALARPRRQDIEVRSFSVSPPGSEVPGCGFVFRDITHQSEVERLKVGMLSTVSHELRTPLAVIKGFATSLLRTDVEWDESNKRDFVEQIDRECDRLSIMVRNLLDMSRLEAGTLRLDREWCDVGDLIADIVGGIAPIVVGHQVRLATQGPGIFAFIDRRYLERVVLNLVENAAKYSRGESTITIELARRSEAVYLSVRDEGIGIPPEERERIFERFYRGTGARAGAGVGLGLAICKGIVEAHGGILSVESEVGRGSVFTLRLPDQLSEGLAQAAPRRRADLDRLR